LSADKLTWKNPATDDNTFNAVSQKIVAADPMQRWKNYARDVKKALEGG
jgi:hypothetical protein